MAVIDIGNAATDRASTAPENNTWVDNINPANASGTITSVEFYFTGAVTNVLVATFYRPDPDNFPNNLSTRDTEAIGNLAGGYHQLEVNLDVTEGDYIGIYFSSSSLEKDNVSADDKAWYKSLDNIPCTNTTFSLDTYNKISLYGTGTTEVPSVTKKKNVIFMGSNF